MRSVLVATLSCTLVFSLACAGLQPPPPQRVVLDPGTDGSVENGGDVGRIAPQMKIEATSRPRLVPSITRAEPSANAGVSRDQCDDLQDGGPMSGPDCITGEISCGETVIGHTAGGWDKNTFTKRMYEKDFCTPAFHDYDQGDERVYRLTVPEGDHRAFVTLDSPCADLDLGAFKFRGDVCPTQSSLVSRCEMKPKPKGQQEVVELVSRHQTQWFIVVEGKAQEAGLFSLTVQCRPGLY